MDRQVGAVLLAASLALLGACRDAPELLEPPELAPLGPAPYQLTFDPGRDLAPSWSASGDSVIYVTERLVPPMPPAQPDTMRIGRPLKVIHRNGGTARRVLPQLQTTEDGTVPIDFAVQSADGRVAAFTLLPLLPPALCGPSIVACSPPSAAEAPPRLDGGILRVREPESGTAPSLDSQLEVRFPGRRFDTTRNPDGLAGVWDVEVHPFQRRFIADRRAPDRISWSPEGDRLTYSDGVTLRIWDPLTGESMPIPGTADGVDPAWSPTGTWIAFERYEKGPPSEAICEHRQVPIPPETEPGPVLCIEERQAWPLLGRSIALIRPDGSDLRLLPEGGRPTWSADGQRVYYEANRQIWSVGLDGHDPAPVPATERGFHPAVSPDGRWLAFARIDSLSAMSDIWIVELEP